MLYSKMSAAMFEYSGSFLERSISILREDKNAALRLRMTVQKADESYITSETPGYLATDGTPNDWVAVVAMKSVANRDISSYGEVTRNENAPLSPPMTMITFQAGVSYINLISQMHSGNILSNVTISRVHQGEDTITVTESHSYKNCQLLVIRKVDIGNTSLACMILQADGLTVSYAAVPPGGGVPGGSVMAELSFAATT